MKLALLATALVALASPVLTAPAVISGESCSDHCTNSHLFSYETGKSYVYDYSVETSSVMLGVSGDEAQLKFKAHAHVDVTSPCEYVLRVTDVALEDSTHSSDFAEALMKYPMKFSFQDGVIENICSEVSDPTWVVNIKRGFLSTFQNTRHFYKGLHETDVSGECETEYSTHNEGDSIIVEKRKDLTTCSQRHDYLNVISSSYETDSSIQNPSMLKTSNECEQKIQDDIMVKAECHEIYKTRPFQSERSSVVVSVKTTLEYSSQESITSVPSFDFYRQSLVFDDEHIESHTVQIEKVTQLLQDLLTSSEDQIHKETPVLFAELVEYLKGLEYEQLNQVFSNSKEPHMHKFLVDALPLVGTSSAYALVKDLILKEEINEFEADIWYTSLAFQRHPTSKMLESIAPLLENHPSQKALLGSSALINNYCTEHKTCETEPAVKKIIQLIEKDLGSGCRAVTDKEKYRVIVALKALGNAGHWVNAKSTLETCYTEDNDMEIRVAALDAWRHAPCEYDHSQILRVFREESYDPELRIAAYLSLMTCPTPQLISTVKERLISEGVNQVGSFIWTHMTNLQESATPEKQWVRELIGEEILQKKFSTEALRFSRNYESSFFMNDVNVGGSVESNVVFNSKSYLPRSANLNLTLDLFGESINFFEIGGRIDGFEAYIERFFGSNGYFPEEHIEQVLSNMRSNSNADSTTLEGFLEKISDEPEGSYYLRVFGNELHYHHFHGMENIFTSQNAVNPMEFLLDIIRKGNLDYTKSFQLQNTHHYIPTISGMPIELDTRITGTIGLKMDGNFNAQSLYNIDIEGHLYPSAALEFEGDILLDAHVARTGVKFSSTLHTSTFLDGKMKINDGKVVDIVINSPKDKVEVLDIHGEYFYVIDDNEVHREATAKIEHHGCTSGRLGMAVCGSLSYPQLATNAGFPFIDADFYLKKTDTQTSYLLHFKRETDKLEILLDTPGSQNDHKVSLALNRDDTKISADLHTPLKSAKGEIEYSWTNLNKKIRADLSFDSGEKYHVESNLIKTIGDVTVFEPSFVLQIPQGEALNIHGTIKSKLDYYDTQFSAKLDTSYLWRTQETVHFEIDAEKKFTDTSNTYGLYIVVDPSQYPDVKTSLNVLFAEKEHKHYQASVMGLVLGETYKFEGKLDDNSVRGEFDMQAGGNLVTPYLETEAHLKMHADSEKATGEFDATVFGEKYDLKFEGTKKSVMIEANIIQHILLNANMVNTEDHHKLEITGEWNKDVDPSASFKIDGEISQQEAHVQVKFVNHEAFVSGKLLSNAVELQGKWDGKSVSANVHYTLGETKSISVVVETPFQGLEKQDAKFSITLKDHEIKSLIIATWKNSQQVSLKFDGKLEPGTFDNKLHSEIVFTSSFPKFDRISFTFDHKMHDAAINTDMMAVWDSWQVKTHFKNEPNSEGVHSLLSFESPFSEKLLITCDYVHPNNDMTTNFKVQYGSVMATADLKGHIDLSQKQDVTLNLKTHLPIDSIPDLNANLNYKFDWTHLTFVFEGVMGEQKVMLNANGELSKDEHTKVTGDLRLIMPNTLPITASVSHIYDEKSFESKFELTRFWSTYGNLKGLAEGHYNSIEDVHFKAELFTPSTKSQIYLDHKVSGNNMTSSLEFNVNAEKILVLVNGLLDASQNIANLEAELTSTISGLDDVKIHIESKKNSNERISTFVITKDEHTVTIDHIISFSDALNWENSFTLNGQYKLKNVQTHAGTIYTHDLEYSWDSQNIHLKANLDNKSSSGSHDVDVKLSVETPWTQIFRIELHHVDNHVEYKPVLTIEYVPGRKIILDTIVRFGDAFHCEALLTTPFTEPIGFELTLDFSPLKSAYLLLKWGAKNASVNISGKLESRKFEGHLEIKSSYLTKPITAEASYNFEAPQRKIHLLINYIQKHEITGLLSGNLNKGDWSFEADVNLYSVKHIKLNGSWMYEPKHAQIDIHSSVDSFDDIELFAMYNIENEKKVESKLKYGSKEIDLSGSLEGETVIVDITTPFSGWEHMKFSLFVSDTAIDTFVSKNDQKISVKGTLHVKSEKGSINLAIETPFTNYETISADLSYSLRGPIKQVKLKSVLPSGDITLNGDMDLSKDLSPSMKLDVITPFSVISKIGGEANWNLKERERSAHIRAYRNDRKYQWDLEEAFEGFYKRQVKSSITTPFSGWTSVNLESDFDVTHMPYMFKFIFDKEGDIKVVEGNFNLENKKISIQLNTPITGWENINFAGDFNWEPRHFTGKFELTNAGSKYQFSADIFSNMEKPKLHFTLVTPFEALNNIDFLFEANLETTNKVAHITLKSNDDSYSLEFNGEMLYKTGHVDFQLQLPIAGFNNVEVKAEYDFTNDIKTAEFDLKKDNSPYFHIKTDVQNNKYNIEVHTPFEGFEDIKMVGDYTTIHDKHTVLASFEKNHQRYDYNADVTLTDYSFDIGLSTPIPGMKNVAISVKYELFKNGVEGLLHFEKEGQKYEIKGRGNFTPMKSSVYVGVNTPLPGWEKLVFDFKYDVLSVKKSAVLHLEKDSFKKEITLEGEYTMKSGSIKVRLPIRGFELLGGSYTLDLDSGRNKVDTTLKIFKNSKEWNFAVHGEFSDRKILIRFQTPFEGFEAISFDGNIDFSQKIAHLGVELGEYKFGLHASYAINDILLKLTTPFDVLKIVSFGFSYKWTAGQKDATLNIIYNNQNYVVSGHLNLSPRISEITLQATTPFSGFNNIQMMFKYNIDSESDILSATMTSDQYSYSFKLGAGLSGTEAHLEWVFTSSFEGWNKVQFLSKFNWAPGQKSIELSLGKNENLEAITLTGKLVEFSEGILIIHTPFRHMENMGGQFKYIPGDKLQGKLDLYLPFYILPKIHGDVDLDLSGKIQGDMNVDIAGELYTIKTNLVGASFSDGYSGDLEIYTPIHSLSKIIIHGNISMKFNLLKSLVKTHFNVELPSGTYEMDLETGFDFDSASFDCLLDTTIMNIHRKVALEVKYPSLEYLEGKLVTILNDQKHEIEGTLSLTESEYVCTMKLESSLINGPRKVSVALAFPENTYYHVTLKTEFIASDSHSLDFDIYIYNTAEVSVHMETPIFPKFTVTLKVEDSKASIILNTPNGDHKVQVSWKLTYKMPADYLFFVDVESPLLPRKHYALNLLLKGNKTNMSFKAEVLLGNMKNVIEASTSMTDSMGEASLNIGMPIFAFNAELAASLKFTNQVEMHITAIFDNKENTFDFVYDKSARSFHVEIKSPFIPTGLVAGDGQLTGELMTNMQIKMSLKNNKNIISGTLNSRGVSDNNVKMTLMVTTPYKGYKKMKFGAEYVKDDETKIVFFCDKPVKFHSELHLKYREDEVRSYVLVETPIEQFKVIEGEVKIPLNVFAPKISADVKVDGVYYGGHVNLRTKAPYELGLGYNVADYYKRDFHIRTDSSFFYYLH